jgi:hypothetical protein
MEIKVKLDVCPFNTPNFVRTKRINAKEDLDNAVMRLSDLDEDTLSFMCDEFRKTVFSKAMKKDPSLDV